MDLRKVLPRGKISQEAMQALAPVFEGEVLVKEERYDQAVAKYRQALDNFPARSSGRFMIYNKLGIAYEKLEDYGRAIEVYKKCVDEGSITPFTYHRLASLHFELGKLIPAFEYGKKGIASLKPAKTDFFQELYFHFIFRKLLWKIRRRMKSITLAKKTGANKKS
jgi:tetratricopeptide (TPR) repeat protein